MNKITVMILCLAALSAQAKDTRSPSATQNAATANQQAAISPLQASSMLTEKKAVIIDVREDDEWNEQHIPGAIHIPLGQLNSRLTELEQYKQTPIITQCQKGGRSQQALAQLKSAGFANVYNLEGGLVAWEKAGLKTQ